MEMECTSKIENESSWTTVAKVPVEEHSFEWAIVNFKNLMETSRELFCESDDTLRADAATKMHYFSTGNTNDLKTIWNILLYPCLWEYKNEHGKRKVSVRDLQHRSYKSYLSIRLDCYKINPNIYEAKYWISLVSLDGKEVHTIKNEYKRNDGWSTANIIKFNLPKSLACQEELLPNGTLTVRCHLKLVYFSSLDDFRAIIPSVFSCQSTAKLASDIRDLFETQRCCDATIFCDGSEFPVHKAILSARSQVFSSMFEHNMVEKNTNVVHINDIKKNVMKEFLRYIYGNDICYKDPEICIGLYAAADKYAISDLKTFCCATLKESLSDNNVCDITVIANIHSDAELFSAAQNYIRKNAIRLLISTKWINFVHNYHDIADRIING